MNEPETTIPPVYTAAPAASVDVHEEREQGEQTRDTENIDELKSLVQEGTIIEKKLYAVLDSLRMRRLRNGIDSKQDTFN